MISQRAIVTILLLAVPALLVGALAAVLMTWRVATRVQMDLPVRRVVFTLKAQGLVPILTSIGFKSLTVEKFQRMTLSPDSFEVADPAQSAESGYPESAWRAVTVPGEIVLSAQDAALQPSVTIESPTAKPELGGRLGIVFAQPGSLITLETPENASAPRLTIKVENAQVSTTVTPSDLFHIITTHAVASGTGPIPFRGDALTYRARLSDRSPFIAISSQPRSLVLTLRMLKDAHTELLPSEGVPIGKIDLTTQGAGGSRETALIGPGELTYPDYADQDPVSVGAQDYVDIGQLRKFAITHLSFDPDKIAMRVRMDGVAGRIRTGSWQFAKDRRLTAFDVIWRSSRLAVLGTLVASVFSATLAGYKLYREFSA